MAQARATDTGHGHERTALLSLAVAALLVALKLGAGLASGNLSMISAGLESSGDVIAAVITFFAIRLGRRPADRGHPYGHRRAENLGALGESVILLAGAIVISAAAIVRLVRGTPAEGTHRYQFAVILFAMALDAGRISASIRAARRLESPALRANAVHFAGDLAGSVVVLAGLLAVRSGVEQGDAVAALIVAAIIFVATARLMEANANVLMDRAPWQARAAAERAITEIGEGIELSRLRLRESAGRYFADVVVSVPAGQALVEGHRSADLVEDAVERALPGSDVVVHVEPRARGTDLRERVFAIALSEPLVKEAHDIAVFEQDGGVCVSLHLKFPADIDLHSAHETAERVEDAIRARPGVVDVQTHLEPMERPLAAAAADAAALEQTRAQAMRLVRERTGAEPRRVRVLATEGGVVVFLTLAVDPRETLLQAHELASELEDELHRQLPAIAEVVVHTEP
jgi:cation diffusion facilitator family transporter